MEGGRYRPGAGENASPHELQQLLHPADDNMVFRRRIVVAVTPQISGLARCASRVILRFDAATYRWKGPWRFYRPRQISEV